MILYSFEFSKTNFQALKKEENTENYKRDYNTYVQLELTYINYGVYPGNGPHYDISEMASYKKTTIA